MCAPVGSRKTSGVPQNRTIILSTERRAMDLPNCKPTHLRGYDYTTNGAYFVTICAHNKKCILGDAVSPVHAVIEKWILAIAEKYPNVRIDKYVVMPNHVHFILMLENPQLAAEKSFSA